MTKPRISRANMADAGIRFKTWDEFGAYSTDWLCLAADYIDELRFSAFTSALQVQFVAHLSAARALWLDSAPKSAAPARP